MVDAPLTMVTSGRVRWRTAALAFAVAVATFAAGVAISAAFYPEQPYDWAYVVMSALASRKHNPEGGHWFAVALGLSMLALWPVVSYLRATARFRWPIVALRIALVCGFAMFIEWIVFHHLSDLIRKAHEVLAIGVFVGLYVGVLGLYAGRIRQDVRALAGAAIVGAPLLAIGITQLALYFDQRDLGWVDHSWRALGVPVWLSFAFWQWLAVALLWVGLWQLLWTERSVDSPR
jgi:hypothetical protein